MSSALSPVEICNQALGWLGANLITSLDEDSTEAKLCKANYAGLRDSVIEDHEWSFARKRFRVTALPDPEMLYSPALAFQIDPLALRVLLVSRDNRFLTSERITWEIEDNKIIVETGLVRQNPSEGGVVALFYKALTRIEDASRFTPNFSQALAARIAGDLAMPIVENEGVMNAMFTLYLQKLDNAAATDGMQGSTRRARSTWMNEARIGGGVGPVA